MNDTIEQMIRDVLDDPTVQVTHVHISAIKEGCVVDVTISKMEELD